MPNSEEIGIIVYVQLLLHFNGKMYHFYPRRFLINKTNSTNGFYVFAYIYLLLQRL